MERSDEAEHVHPIGPRPPPGWCEFEVALRQHPPLGLLVRRGIPNQMPIRSTCTTPSETDRFGTIARHRHRRSTYRAVAAKDALNRSVTCRSACPTAVQDRLRIDDLQAVPLLKVSAPDQRYRDPPAAACPRRRPAPSSAPPPPGPTRASWLPIRYERVANCVPGRKARGLVEHLRDVAAAQLPLGVRVTRISPRAIPSHPPDGIAAVHKLAVHPVPDSRAVARSSAYSGTG